MSVVENPECNFGASNDGADVFFCVAKNNAKDELVNERCPKIYQKKIANNYKIFQKTLNYKDNDELEITNYELRMKTIRNS